jgi:thioredoxin
VESGTVPNPAVVNIENGAAFRETVLKAPVPVLVDFWAPWCPPCRTQGPIVEDLAEENSGKIRVVKVNVDEFENLARRYNVQAIPTLIVFHEGDATQKLVGLQSKNRLKRALGI